MRYRLRPRFSLLVLLGILTIAAVGLAWFGRSYRIMQAERQKLAGTWLILDTNGTGRMLMGKPYTTELLREGNVLRMPRKDGIGQLDFAMLDGSGVSLGIYRRYGKRIEVAQAEVGFPRPHDFVSDKGQSVWICELVDNPVFP